MKKEFPLLFAALAMAFVQLSKAQNTQNAPKKIDRHFFIENRGQWPSEVLYLCQMAGLDVWITKWGANYTFYKVKRTESAEPIYSARVNRKEEISSSILTGHRVLFKLEGQVLNPKIEGKQQQTGYYNYFIR